MEPVSAVELLPGGRGVRVLDQTLLPAEERYVELGSTEEVAEAIRSLRVRGAPAIGIAAAYALATDLVRFCEAGATPTGHGVLGRFEEGADLLVATRPTAVNLPWAVDRMGSRLRGWLRGGGSPGDSGRELEREALRIHEEDRAACLAIGECWRHVLPASAEAGAVGVLTHCNAGALATGGMGTALAPLYLAHSRGVELSVFVGETRPLQQGGRLTAWELSREGIPVTVLPDSAAAAAMAAGKVNLVIVGADRVAANGDVANKIGTYGLALLAREHGLPFYVALPGSTFDPRAENGAGIPVEVRSESEVRGSPERAAVPRAAAVWNPSFDITPAHLVTAFLTPYGVIRPPFGPAIQTIARSQDGPISGSDHDE